MESKKVSTSVYEIEANGTTYRVRYCYDGKDKGLWVIEISDGENWIIADSANYKRVCVRLIEEDYVGSKSQTEWLKIIAEMQEYREHNKNEVCSCEKCRLSRFPFGKGLSANNVF